MKLANRKLKALSGEDSLLKLPLEPMHPWRSAPDDNGETRWMCCGSRIHVGDPVVGCYHEFVSVVFCPKCVADNADRIRDWLVVRG